MLNLAWKMPGLAGITLIKHKSGAAHACNGEAQMTPQGQGLTPGACACRCWLQAYG